MTADITIEQAGTWPTYQLTLTRSGNPVPLAGATAVLSAFHARYSGWEIRRSLEVDDPTAGTLLCEFFAADTVHPPGIYNIRLGITWGDGSSTTLPASGYFQMDIGPAPEAEDVLPEPLRVYERSGSTLVLLAVIDAYEAIEWTRRWRSPGSWQAVIPRYATGADALQEGGRFISLPRQGDHLIGIIESMEIQLTDEGEVSESWTVTGRSLGAILQNRICLHGGVSTGTGYDEQLAVAGETAMRHYVDVNAINQPMRSGRSLDCLLQLMTRGGEARPLRSGPVSGSARCAGVLRSAIGARMVC
ncbi:hypothetical protein [Methanogenium cariaci]|uniref:Gp37-like protein n=1 Tax=Methanogenium cariaci TaxID=2197 RepID=UPI000781C731|nr:hypothetical protein [Methanogenium cariaci]